MTLPGPGDPATWPATITHPNDPRQIDIEDYCPECSEWLNAADGCCGCGWDRPDPDPYAYHDPENDL